jgi:hypothetical protein
VLDAEFAAGQGADDGAIGGTVVGEAPLDLDALAGEEGECTVEEGDVHVLPASRWRRLPAAAVQVGL